MFPAPTSARPAVMRRMLFVLESGTDVRMVNGLAGEFSLTVVFRRLPQGREINYPSDVPTTVRPGPASRLAFAAWLLFHLLRRAGDYDAVLVQGYGPAALACNLHARLGGCRRTLMLVCSPVEAYYRCKLRQQGGRTSSPALRVLQTLAWINARLGRGYVVLSDHLSEVVRQHGTCRPVHRIPIYGVDLILFRPLTEGEHQEELKTRLGLPTDGKILFFSSRIAPEKDATTLLAAFRQLLDAGENLWLLHRSGGFRQFLEEAQRFGVEARVNATDACYPGAELAADYRACDLCVQASWEEGLGFSVLEALASGIPVVAAAAGGLRETIRPGETGWTYPPGDVDALAACIHAALHDPVAARERAAAGRRTVEADYASPAVFARLAHVFHDDDAS